MRFYIPIATKSRDLYGALLLSSVAAEYGISCLIGPWASVLKHARSQNNGVVFLHGVAARWIKTIEYLKSRGHLIASLSEGSLVYRDGAEYTRVHMSGQAAAHYDLIFVSGRRQYADIRKHLNFRGQLIVSGHPRFDTLLPKARKIYESRAQSIKKKYGNFLLVNTNYSFGNPPHWRDIVGSLQKRKKIRNDDDKALTESFIQYQQKEMKALRQALKQSEIPNIVIRPHPAECALEWRKWGKAHGVFVDSSGDAISWIMAANGMLHTGCTTGIEGAILGSKVASFFPDSTSKYKNPSHGFGTKVRNGKELKEFFQGSAENIGTSPSRSELTSLEDLLYLSTPRGSSEVILEHISKQFEKRAKRNDIEAYMQARRILEVYESSKSSVQNMARAILRRGRPKFFHIYRVEIKEVFSALIDEGIVCSAPDLIYVGDNCWLCTEAKKGCKEHH